MLRFLTYAILAYLVWKLIKLFALRKSREGPVGNPPVDLPQDQAYKNIEDADFEDITGDSDKPS